MPNEITDPAILARFNIAGAQSVGPQEITDPTILSQFGIGSTPEDTPPTSGPVSYANDVVPQVPTGGFLRNAVLGAGQDVDSLLRGGKQLYARATGNKDQLAQLQQQQLLTNKAAQNLDQTWGAKAGNLAETTALTAPLMAIPGAQGVAGGLLAGGTLGALQPTTDASQSPLTSAGIGAAAGAAGAYGGGLLGDWLSARATQPFFGWGVNNANRAAAAAVGSDAPKLTQTAVSDATDALGNIFTRARGPQPVSVSDPTLNVLDQVGAGLNTSTRRAFAANGDIQDLTSYLGTTPTAKQLGTISSNLGNEAKSQMTSQGGDRALGRALFDVQNHVDGLVGSSIADPALAAEYATARTQYRSLQQITANSSTWNSSTGDVNMTALGKYLQRTDKPGYARGGNQSELYNAARWGQAAGTGKGMPPLSIENLVPVAKYFGRQIIARPAGGLLSRVPGLAPALPYGVPGAGIFGAQQAQGLLSP